MTLIFIRIDYLTFVFYREGVIFLDTTFPIYELDIHADADAVYSHTLDIWIKMKLPTAQEQLCRERMRGTA